jgi:hypothetical protein
MYDCFWVNVSLLSSTDCYSSGRFYKRTTKSADRNASNTSQYQSWYELCPPSVFMLL